MTASPKPSIDFAPFYGADNTALISAVATIVTILRSRGVDVPRAVVGEIVDAEIERIARTQPGLVDDHVIAGLVAIDGGSTAQVAA